MVFKFGDIYQMKTSFQDIQVRPERLWEFWHIMIIKPNISRFDLEYKMHVKNKANNPISMTNFMSLDMYYK